MNQLTEVSTSRKWTLELDLDLLEVMLRSIRSGKKKYKAYKEAELIVGRSAAACQYRWTTNLAKTYYTDVEKAKSQRYTMRENNPSSKVTPLPVKDNQISEELFQAAFPSVDETIYAPALPLETEAPVTEGVQQMIDFEKNAITDIQEEISPADDPFARINKFVTKMEREYGDTFKENVQLKKDHHYLIDQLHTVRLEAYSSKQEVDALSKKLDEANKQLASYEEVKALIKQFSNMN